MRDLGFAFNDKDFSDRTLHLELVGDSSDSESDSDGSESSDTQNLHKKQNIGVSTEKGDAACGKNSNGSTVVKIKTVHINSAILASSSPFFYKLFKNGMRESQERNVTLRINASEKRAFMDILKFIYTDTLSATSAPDLVGVLMAADKFEVSSCMSHCSKVLKKMPMSLESALLYLEIPPSVVEGEVVQSLIEDAKDYLVIRFGSVTKSETEAELQEEAMALPLSVIEYLLSVLGADGEVGLGVRSEEDVYKFILKWGRARYPKLRERQEVLTNLVGRFLYFPCLSMSTLREIQDSPDFDSKQVTKLVLESLYLNVGLPYGDDCRLPAAIGHPYIVRRYEDLPIKVLQLESRHFVYLSLTRIACQNLAETGQDSQVFFLGGQSFKLEVGVHYGSDTEADHFGLFVKRQDDNHGKCIFDYELELLNDECGEEDFKSIQKLENCSLSVGERVGSANLFGVPFLDFMSEQCSYFINGILHLRAQFTIKNSGSNSHPLG